MMRLAPAASEMRAGIQQRQVPPLGVLAKDVAAKASDEGFYRSKTDIQRSGMNRCTSLSQTICLYKKCAWIAKWFAAIPVKVACSVLTTKGAMSRSTEPCRPHLSVHKSYILPNGRVRQGMHANRGSNIHLFLGQHSHSHCRPWSSFLTYPLPVVLPNERSAMPSLRHYGPCMLPSVSTG